ncbi:MAG: phosphoribosylamine--glycine ligase [Actinobacteria bacterium]|nr:phosphoribosylamine--glycine ligase [Actinomycetota bacterium]
MKVLVIGSGAREHAIVAALAADASVTEIHAAPGNAGIDDEATLHSVDMLDPAAVTALAREVAADLVVVGPEAPLVAGVADAVRDAGIACFGPSAAAAKLEASKAFAKQVMRAAGVPTARAGVGNDIDTVAMMLAEFGAPHVVKDDGLAAGKGVVVTNDRAEALAHAAAILAKPDGRVVIEEFLDGPEVSLFCITDGQTVVPLQPAQDFKRVADGDLGPNTGGMGAYTPLDWAPENLVADVIASVAQPTIDEMARRGTPFAGVLYIGLALTARGPRVIEFNARFGDPETQVVLASLKTPLAGVLLAAARGELASLPPLQWFPGAAVTVVVAAENYPATPVTGDPILGIDGATALPTVLVLHAGTKSGADGQPVSAGGRVISVVARGTSLADARDVVYQGVEKIELRGSHYRTDIAAKAIDGLIEIPTVSAPPSLGVNT